MNKALLTALMLLTVAVAGCTDDEPAPAEGDGSTGGETGQNGSDNGETGGETGDTGGETGTESGNETENVAPEVTVALGDYSGTIPFDVNVTINATDADGDAMTWTLQRDGADEADGDSFPGVATLSFDAAGAYNITVAVSDGEATTYANFTIEAAEGEPAGPQVIEVITATWRTGAGTRGAAASYQLCEGPEDGNTIAIRDLTALVPGRTFTATVSDDTDGDAVDSWGVIFNSPGCGVDVHSVYSGAAGSQAGAVDISGSIPDGYDLVFFTSYGGANLESTLTIYA